MDTIPNCFYRISIKALVLNETRDKFLICKEDNGYWELPGGGLDWGMSPQEDVPREIQEEMGIPVLSVAEYPSYFLTFKSLRKELWVANVLYETTLAHLNFTPSDECVEVAFVDRETIKDMNVFPAIITLAEMFDPKRHR